ncbi:MAG: GAF domain-containing protein [Desulfopila sp.]|jgi:class 3 adenylate cyclase/putative methionine-R-sulfoxide reductase with GAF domain|nr:GAF domain-containing protein [Desulfopila sp.]
MKYIKNITHNREFKKFFSFHSNSVLYRLTMAFALFFMGPLLGLLFISVKTDLFGSNELLYSLGGLLISTLFGYIIMRQISSGISRVENRMAEKLNTLGNTGKFSEDELENISTFADIMSDSIKKTGESLSKRINEIHALRELSDFSAFQMTAQSLARTALKRSLEVTEGVGGVILFISGNRAVCNLKMGEGLKFQKKQEFLFESFPWHKTIQQNSPLFLQKKRESRWLECFAEECTFAAVVPFGRFGTTTAVAIVAAQEKRKWDETTLEFLSTYFLSIGNALKIKEINNKKQEADRELNVVLSIIKILNSNPEKNDLLASIAQKVEEVIPHHWIGLALQSESGKHLYLSHSFSKFAPHIKTGQRIATKRSLFHLAMQSKEAISIDNLVSRADFCEKKLFQRLGLKSCVISNLNSSGRAIGAICLGSEKEARFGHKEKRIFVMIAMAVAIAIEQSKIFARERAKRVELEILNKIGGALTSHTIRANKVLTYILERVADLVDVEAGSIMLLEFDALVVEAATGEFSKELKKQKFRLDHGVVGYVVATGEPVIVDDTRENPHFLSGVDEKTGFQTRSLLCVPLISGGRVIGVIELLNRKGKPFSQDDLQAVKAVAASTAIALENTRLYSETNHIAKKEKFIRTIFQKYVPEEIVTKILERGDADQMAVSEKRIVTVFNVDLRGYTQMSKQASTEDVIHILNHFFRRMGNIIIKHRGLLDKYLGDGILAIFGAPAATANPALDAVLAAQEMVKVIDKLSILSIDRCGIPLRIGVSINTGEAIVGNIGFAKKMEYTVIGDVVNETFRLQDLTRFKANSILIGETTYNQVKSVVRTRPYGLKKLDTSLVNVYEVESDSIGENSAAPLTHPLEAVGLVSTKIH